MVVEVVWSDWLSCGVTAMRKLTTVSGPFARCGRTRWSIGWCGTRREGGCRQILGLSFADMRRSEVFLSQFLYVPLLSLLHSAERWWEQSVSNLVLEDIVLDCAGQWSSEESRNGMQGRLQWVEWSFSQAFKQVKRHLARQEVKMCVLYDLKLAKELCDAQSNT